MRIKAFDAVEFEENGAEDWKTKSAAFVAAHVRPAESGAQAATAEEVRRAFLTRTACDKKSAALRLAGAGFAEVLAHHRDGHKATSKRTYSYAFGGETRYVRLQPAPKP